jgi:hypothetical protein
LPEVFRIVDGSLTEHYRDNLRATTVARFDDNRMTNVKSGNDIAASGNGSGCHLVRHDTAFERPAGQHANGNIAQ